MPHWANEHDCAQTGNGRTRQDERAVTIPCLPHPPKRSMRMGGSQGRFTERSASRVSRHLPEQTPVLPGWSHQDSRPTSCEPEPLHLVPLSTRSSHDSSCHSPQDRCGPLSGAPIGREGINPGSPWATPLPGWMPRVPAALLAYVGECAMGRRQL